MFGVGSLEETTHALNLHWLSNFHGIHELQIHIQSSTTKAFTACVCIWCVRTYSIRRVQSAKYNSIHWIWKRDENKFNIPFTVWHSIRDVYLDEFARKIRTHVRQPHRRRSQNGLIEWWITMFAFVLCVRVILTLRRVPEKATSK